MTSAASALLAIASWALDPTSSVTTTVGTSEGVRFAVPRGSRLVEIPGKDGVLYYAPTDSGWVGVYLSLARVPLGEVLPPSALARTRTGSLRTKTPGNLRFAYHSELYRMAFRPGMHREGAAVRDIIQESGPFIAWIAAEAHDREVADALAEAVSDSLVAGPAHRNTRVVGCYESARLVRMCLDPDGGLREQGAEHGEGFDTRGQWFATRDTLVLWHEDSREEQRYKVAPSFLRVGTTNWRRVPP